MGFERLTSILQNKMSNYDTDIFAPLFAAIQATTGAAPYGALLGAEDVDGRDMAYRVIADHARTLTFAITDGAVPSNEGRGYVLRRILRRAVRYGQQFLKAKPGFFSELVPVVVATFSEAFPELAGKRSFVQEVIRDEEDSFTRTLANGIKAFNKMAEKVKAAGGTSLPGADAFFLYDSMGFPLDLTQIMAGEQGLAVDAEGFVRAMAEQKARSQAASKFSRTHERLVLEAEETAWLAKHGVTPTVDAAKYSLLDGEPTAVIRAIYTKEGFLEGSAAATVETPAVGVILDATSFYAESGGQAADAGTLTLETSAGGEPVVMDVDDVQVFGGFVLHTGTLRRSGDAAGAGDAAAALRVGDRVRCAVDAERRARIAPNHTMTHVLNFALREVLGSGVEQRGSTVQPDKLRFDYSINKAPTPDQLAAVEAIVNERIDAALPVHSEVVPLAAARSLHTLRAVFGETYPDPVRVIAVGQSVPDLLRDPENAAWMALSVELCGGTHIKNTSQAARFAIVEEGSISKGVRRVVAVTREAAIAAHGRAAELKQEFSNARALTGAALERRAEELKKEIDGEAPLPAHVRSRLRDELADLFKRVNTEAKAAAAKVGDAAKAAALEAVRASKAAGRRATVLELPLLKGDAGQQKVIATGLAKEEPAAALLIVTSDGASKVAAFAVVPAEAAVAGLKANEWVNAALAAAGGRGGGTETSAAGSSKEFGRAGEVVAAANAFAEGKY
jgi:alanyl-tRNA synthetase